MSVTNTASIVYQAAYRALAATAGQSLRMFPLPADCPIQFAAYGFEQAFEMSALTFPPAAKNTPSNATSGGNPVFSGLADANAILTTLSNPSFAGGYNVKFSARFNIVPASWDDFKMMTYTYPGIPGPIGGASRNVGIPNGNFLVRIHYDYFVVDPANIISAVVAGTPGNATSVTDSGGTLVKCVYQKADIPSVRKSQFFPLISGAYNYNLPTLSIIPAGGATVGSLTYYETLPTLAQYEAWIAKATSAGWAATAWNGQSGTGSGDAGDATVGQMVAEDSSLATYAGNIVARATIYILAR
jgi:hypothetical protein